MIRGVARRHKEVRIVQLRQFERSRFFTGQVLTADDLQREQDYHRDKARLHNRFLHGWETKGVRPLNRLSIRLRPRWTTFLSILLGGVFSAIR